MRRIIPPFWLLLAIMLMAGLDLVAPVYEIARPLLSQLGALFVLAGLLLFVWAVRGIFRAKTTIKPFEESSALVTTGPFGWSRNPIYLAMVLLLLGAALLFGSLTPLLVPLLFALLIDRVFIRGEEEMLQATFGEEYAQYCQLVRRWV